MGGGDVGSLIPMEPERDSKTRPQREARGRAICASGSREGYTATERRTCLKVPPFLSARKQRLKLISNLQIPLHDAPAGLTLAVILGLTGEIKVFLRLAEDVGELRVGIDHPAHYQLARRRARRLDFTATLFQREYP